MPNPQPPSLASSIAFRGLRLRSASEATRANSIFYKSLWIMQESPPAWNNNHSAKLAKARLGPISDMGIGCISRLVAAFQLNGSYDECTSESFDHVLQLAWPLAKVCPGTLACVVDACSSGCKAGRRVQYACCQIDTSSVSGY